MTAVCAVIGRTLPEVRASNSAHSLGYLALYATQLAFHSASSAAPLAMAFLQVDIRHGTT